MPRDLINDKSALLKVFTTASTDFDLWRHVVLPGHNARTFFRENIVDSVVRLIAQ